MNYEIIAGGVALVVIIVVFSALLYKKGPKRVKTKHYTKEWKQIQKICPNKDTWAQAIVEADELLDDVLKKKRFKGGSMGERLVAAQKTFTDNDGVWYAHKLRKKIETDSHTKLKKADVKDALMAIRQGLKDLGAL